MPRLFPPSGLVRSYSSRQSASYTSQDVSLVVWQIAVYDHNLALTAAYGTEVAINDGPGPTLSLLLLMSYTRNFRSLEFYQNLEGCSWPRPPADHEDPSPRNERWKFPLEFY
jgi:hypothetical protein